ncbi:hypothetical protein FQZ97_849460 [compost metagenome]
MQHGVGVAQPLEQAEPLAEQGVVHAEDLHHAPRPADPLAHVGGQAVGGQARRQGDAHVRRVPPGAVQAQGGVGVLGDGLGRETADVVQGFAAQHRAGAAEEGGVPQVVAVLDQPVEQLALVGLAAEGPQVVLEGVGGEEVVRRLHQGHLRVLEEPADGHLQEGPHRDVVAVEHRHQVAVQAFQGMVQVARLGAPVVVAVDVADPDLLGELAELLAGTVVQHEDPELVPWPVEAQGGHDRGAHHREVFVVGGDQEVDARPQALVVRQRQHRPAQRPDALHEAQDQHQPGVGFGQQQGQPQDQVQAVGPVQRRGVAPPEVAAGDGDREDDQHQGGETPGHVAHQHGQYPQGEHEHQLGVEVEG